MTFTEKIKTGLFWKNVAKIAVPFFIVVLIISILFNSFSSTIHLDIETLQTQYLSDGKWQVFVLPKFIISIAYGIWMTQRKMK